MIMTIIGIVMIMMIATIEGAVAAIKMIVTIRIKREREETEGIIVNLGIVQKL